MSGAAPEDRPAGDKPRVRADTDSRTRKLILTPASDIEPEPVVWAWEDEGDGRIPAGSLGLFAGREGTGKSSFLIYQGAQVTRGWLPGAFQDDPRAVIYVAVEDSWKYTIVPRLLAANADLDRVYRAEVQVIEEATVSLSLPYDIVLLEQAITDCGVGLVVLDPLLSAISDTLDTHVNRQVRQALDPLARLADRTGVVIAGIAHFNKSSGTDASSLITASGAFKDVARFIFAFATDDDGSQIITQTKNSLGRSDLPSLAYRITEAVVPTPKGEARVGRFVPGGVSERSVHDVLRDQTSGSLDPDEKTRAEDYLRKALAGGPRPTRDVQEEAQQVHAISKRTLERGRRDLRIATAKRADGWWISLPEHEGDLRSEFNSANFATPPPPGELGGLGGVESSATLLPGKTAKAAKTSSPGPVSPLGPSTSAQGDEDDPWVSPSEDTDEMGTSPLPATESDRGTCPHCKLEFRLTSKGLLPRHGYRSTCPGGGGLPE